MMKSYKFMATFQTLYNNDIDIIISIDLRQSEMPDEIGDYYVAFNKALDVARSRRSIDQVLIGIKYVAE